MAQNHFTERTQAMSTVKNVVVFMILIGCFAGAFAAAIDPIPEEGGFSGRVNVGANWMRVTGQRNQHYTVIRR
jgi:hypothetical protein